MTGLRFVLIAVWLAGLGLGSMSERPPATTPRIHEGFRVLAADFHVHSFPGDGALPPWTIAQEARRRGLDVVALTNHNHMLSWPLARWAAPPPDGVLLLPAEEVTTPAFHMTAVGIARTVAWRRSASAVAAEVHEAGGVAIVAHPDARTVRAIGGAFADADGVEAAHPMRHGAPKGKQEIEAAVARAMAVHPGIALVGASDFHYLAPLGVCRTYVFARDGTAGAVLEAIRAGRTVACDARGQTYGDARLASAVAGECRAAAGGPSTVDRQLNRVALACAWLGALGLTLTGPRRTD